MENQLVESVTKFTYLGSDVVSSSSSTPEVHRRIGLANSIVGQLDRVCRNGRLSLNTKLRLYTSLVQSILLHECETWTLRPKPTRPDGRLFTWRHNGASWTYSGMTLSPMIPLGARQSLQSEYERMCLAIYYPNENTALILQLIYLLIKIE